jgi:hypothetical protein
VVHIKFWLGTSRDDVIDLAIGWRITLIKVDLTEVVCALKWAIS